MSVNDYQVGGSHYAKGGAVQHWDFVELNGLGYLEGCATKYVTRWRQKNGVQDLNKAVHYLEKLVELNGGLMRRVGRMFVQWWRRNRGYSPLSITVEEFTQANDLAPEEIEIIRAITLWETAGDLGLAIGLIKSLIAKASVP